MSPVRALDLFVIWVIFTGLCRSAHPHVSHLCSLSWTQNTQVLAALSVWVRLWGLHSAWALAKIPGCLSTLDMHDAFKTGSLLYCPQHNPVQCVNRKVMYSVTHDTACHIHCNTRHCISHCNTRHSVIYIVLKNIQQWQLELYWLYRMSTLDFYNFNPLAVGSGFSHNDSCRYLCD